MKISRALLRQGLEGLINLPANSFSSMEFNLGFPMFFSDFSTLTENRVYLSLTPLQPPETPVPNGCVVFLPYSDAPVSYNFNIFRLPEGISPTEIFNRIVGIFDRWSRFHEDLSNLLDQRQPVEAVLERCARELGNPLYLHNHLYELLAVSEPLPMAEPGQISQIIRSLNNDPTYRKLKDSESFFSISASFTEYPFLCCNVWSDRPHYDYRIVLVGLRRKITAEDESAFRLLCDHVQRTMRLPSERSRLFSGSTDTQKLRQFFTAALSQSPPDYPRLTAELAPHGWLQEHSYCVLASQLPQTDTDRYSTPLLRQQMEQHFPDSATVVQNDQILLIVNLSRNGSPIHQLVHGAVYFLRDNFLKVGISTPSQGLRQLESCCIQARIALNYILSGNSYAWRIHFREVALAYILSNCCGQLSPQAVCSQKLLQLRQYDADHNTELYQTLRCYIECHFNALEATRKLFIHRSTFLYRLERAKSLFGIDLDDPDELLHIMISIRLLDREKQD